MQDPVPGGDPQSWENHIAPLWGAQPAPPASSGDGVVRLPGPRASTRLDLSAPFLPPCPVPQASFCPTLQAPLKPRHSPCLASSHRRLTFPACPTGLAQPPSARRGGSWRGLCSEPGGRQGHAQTLLPSAQPGLLWKETGEQRVFRASRCPCMDALLWTHPPQRCPLLSSPGSHSPPPSPRVRG